MGAKLTCRVK